MPPLEMFNPPALQDDFTGRPEEMRRRFRALWSRNVTAWTRQTILGDPWTATDAADRDFYFNALETDIPPGTKPARTPWTANPARIAYYFPDLPQEDKWSLADTGFQTNGERFPPIERNPCTGELDPKTYGPYGPRGFQDEYTEWSVTRDPLTRKIVRVDFTCENPEYFYTVWSVDPDLVCEIYRAALAKPQIRVADLYLTDGAGAPVIDPSTGRPAYNPLNKWNRGTVSTPESGGAMHLTSTPNTLQTQLDLAGSATHQRLSGNGDPERLICCGKFGQARRASDPSIGQFVNQTVQGPGRPNLAALADPTGLYIQTPNFGAFRMPEGYRGDKKPRDFWRVSRGSERNQHILHASYEVDPGLGFVVGDLRILSGGRARNIEYGAQIAEHFQVAIFATPIPTDRVPAKKPCVEDAPKPVAAPHQLFHAALWSAYLATPVANPQGVPMNLAANTVIAPVSVRQGESGVDLVLTCSAVRAGAELPAVSFSAPGEPEDIAVRVVSKEEVQYCVPGNTYPATYTALELKITVAPGARAGLRDVWVTNPGDAPSRGAKCHLDVVPAARAAV